MKILLVDESYPLNTRNTKILSSLTQSYPSAEVHVVTWDRAGEFHYSNETNRRWQWHLYTRPAVYGNKIQKLIGMFGYRSFCSKTVARVHPDVIIASHWNNLLMLPCLDCKSQMLIYENLDAPTGPTLFRKILNSIEHMYMKQALTVHASRFYSSIYPKRYNQIILENKPVFDVIPASYAPRNPLRIAYLGNIRYLDILKNLADAVRGDDRFCVSYHGGGPDFQQLKEYVEGVSNVELTGPYQYEDISSLYKDADIIWAAYPNKDYNVRYAISNKFHESLAYAVPAIFAEETCLGEYVESSGLGFQVNPYSVDSIRKMLDGIYNDRTCLMNIHHTLAKQFLRETSWNEDFFKLKEKIDAFFNS